MSKSFKYGNTVNRAFSKSLYYQDITEYFSEYLVDLRSSNIYNDKLIKTKNTLTENLVAFGDSQFMDINVSGQVVYSSVIIDDPTISTRLVIDITNYNTNNIIVKHEYGADINLPAAANNTGIKYTIKNISTNITNIFPYVGENIDDKTEISLNQWASVTLYSDGMLWIILSTL
jgi:hypothetical protein